MIKSMIVGTCLLLPLLPIQGLAGNAGSHERAVYHLDDSGNARWAMILAEAHLKYSV